MSYFIIEIHMVQFPLVIVYISVPIGHSVHLKEEYGHIKKVLELLKYDDHNWIICVHLKMVNFLLGQQGGYTKYPCFLCL